MNVRDDPLHKMAWVVKRETPPKGGGFFLNFNIEKHIVIEFDIHHPRKKQKERTSVSEIFHWVERVSGKKLSYQESVTRGKIALASERSWPL